jgi:hypothetical protein
MFPSFDRTRRTGSRANLRLQFLSQIFRNPQGNTQYFGAWHLQDGSPCGLIRILDHDLVLQLAIGLHLDHILRPFLLGGGLLRLLDFLV